MDYVRDTQCERCHLWYDGIDLNDMGQGWAICTRCVEALWPSEEDDGYSQRLTHEGQYEDETPRELDRLVSAQAARELQAWFSL